MFTRTHYQVIALAIRASRISNTPNLIDAKVLVGLLSFHFELDNSRFNSSAFRKDCGEEQTKQG